MDHFFYRKNLIGLLLLFFCQLLLAQKAILSGKVSDSNGELLTGATVRIDEGKFNVQTNQYGFFSISLPTGKHLIYVRYLGYAADTSEIDVQKNTEIAISLKPAQLQEVVITADNASASDKTGSFVLPLAQLAKIPSLAGEQDVLKAMTFTPGVSTGNEGTVGLYVRGGTPDQNLILLDDAVVYNPAHLYGFLSVFNPDALKHVELTKGNGPARYGGRTSSVLDIRMKDGNQVKRKAEMGIGLISSRLLLEGPAFRKKGSYMVAGRGAYLGLIGSIGRIQYNRGKATAYTGYNMGDFNAKMNYRISDKTTLLLSTYSGIDAMEVFSRDTKTETLKNALQWGNITATAKLNTTLSPKLFLKNMLIYSHFFYKNRLDYFSESESSKEASGYISQSKVTDLTAKSEIDYYFKNNYTIRVGAEVSRHFFTPRNNAIFTTTPDTSVQETLVNQSAAVSAAAYIENEISFTAKTGANLGVRFNNFHIEQRNYFMAEPRVLLYHKVSPAFTIRSAFTGGQQALHLLSNAGLGFQNDVWVPVTRNIRPQKVWQTSFGIAAKIPGTNIDVSADVFYKKLYHQIEYKEGSSTFSSLTKNWFDLVATEGTGVSKGLEIGATRTSGRFTGLFAYTLSRTTRQFESLNNGAAYPFLFDYTHNFNGTGNIRLNKKWDFSGTWVWHTGAAISFPTTALNNLNDNRYIFHYKDRNNARLPDYMRADIGFNRTWNKESGKVKTLNISVYNVLFRRNPLYAKMNNVIVGYNEDQSLKFRKQIQLQGFLPIIPSVSYSVKF
jgi:hypothetical protein